MTLHLTAQQVQTLVFLAGIELAIIAICLVTIAALVMEVRRLERDVASLRRRVLTADSVRQTQAQALRTVDALAQAARGCRS